MPRICVILSATKDQHPLEGVEGKRRKLLCQSEKRFYVKRFEGNTKTQRREET
jgi:hypothetical protein